MNTINVSSQSESALKAYAALQFPGSIDNFGTKTPIHMLMQQAEDEDRVSCARPDEGVLARSRSWYEALGAHILAVSCLCGCDVSVTEAFELQGDEMEVE